MASSSSLYGDRDPTKTKTKHKPINSSTSLAFSSNLSSLISSSKAKPPSDKSTSKSNSKSLSAAPKASLFTAHREAKNPKKRARDDDEQAHQTSLDVGRAEESQLARSKRKMLEKTRLYNAMKRGEYIGRDDDYDDRGLVDFDKKWADAGAHSTSDGNSSDGDDASDTDADSASNTTGTAPETSVTWTDEFGRLRTGTPTQKRRFERSQRIALAAAAAFDSSKARPTAPDTLIHGDTIQHAAFNPDTAVAERMANLAAKRDRPATPPPDTHYDGHAEVRTKGTGFFAFSADEETRQREMAALEAERAETEWKRKGREEAREARRREVEERRRVIAERRTRREADAFLDALDIPDGSGGVAGGEGGEQGGGSTNSSGPPGGHAEGQDAQAGHISNA